MNPYADESVTLYHGDCIEVMRQLPAASVDAVVTDPPYGLEFMGKDWDRPWAVSPTQGVGFAGREQNLTLPSFGDNRNANCRGCGGRQRGKKRCVCSAPDWDRKPGSDMAEFGAWCLTWACEIHRVLKPGGHLLAFGGTRTWHRLACAIEDAGFEVRDSIAWMYGSGFPKSLDVSKAIDKAAGAEREVVGMRSHSAVAHGAAPDATGSHIWTGRLTSAEGVTDAAKQWQGWGTALKPAFEPIVVARKPLIGTVAENVLAHGTGALNIDGCRIGTDGGTRREGKADQPNNAGWENMRGHGIAELNAGRWPANVILDESQAEELDRQSGVLTSGANPTKRSSDKFRDAYGDFTGQAECVPARGADTGGASRFFYTAKADSNERPSYVKTVMRMRSDLTEEQAGQVLAALREAGVQVD